MPKITFASKHCENILEKKEHVLFGISPFNGYFSEEILTKLFLWGTENFKNFHCFVPGNVTTHTLEALGYTPDKAIKKARRQLKYLENKIIRSFGNLGINKQRALEKIITPELLFGNNNNYEHIYNNCINKYFSDRQFREICIQASFDVIVKKQNLEKYQTVANLEKCAHYFLAEMPFFINTPKILNVTSSSFVYQIIPYSIAMLYNGYRENFISPNQGFISVEFELNNECV